MIIVGAPVFIIFGLARSLKQAKKLPPHDNSIMKQNYFSNKMTAKSNTELADIIASDIFVEEAKQAAAWELSTRNIKHDYQPQKETSKDYLRKPIAKTKERDYWVKYHEKKLLFIGLTCIGIAIFLIAPTFFILKKSLIPIEGKVNNIEIFINNVSSSTRPWIKSRKATLQFSLNGVNKIFKLTENIGRDYHHDRFSSIKKSLKNADNATVWIKQTEVDLKYPKVFQIDINNRTILPFDKVKTERGEVFIFLIIFGLGSTGFVLWRKYPRKFNRIINGNPSANKG